MDIYYSVIFFVFGIVFGSFFNVVSYRLPKDMSLIKPHSHCPNCNHKLNTIDLIPIFSYLFQSGKCRYCRKKISIFYPIIEFITGALFTLTYIKFGITINTFVILIFVSMIIIIVLSDILYMIVPDSVLIVCGILMLTLKLIDIKLNNVFGLLLDMAIPFIFILLVMLLGNLLFKKESMGGGDIKLMIIFGMILGWEMSISSIVFASFLALPISTYNLIKKKEHELPFVPYLGLAALIFVFLGISITDILNIFVI